MRHVSLRLLILSLAVLTACQDDAAKLQEHMARGRSYVEGERFREAVIEFKSAQQIDPNHAEAHYALAHVYLRTNRPREGFWELRETVRLDPSNHGAKLEFSQIAIIAGEQGEALRQATSVIEADPSNPRAHLIKGEALDALDRHDEALEAYQQALEVAPDDETGLRALAKAHTHRGNIEQAEALFLRLTELYPRSDNYVAMSRFYRRLGPERFDDLEVTLNKGAEVAEGPERQPAIARLASFYYQTGRSDEAFALLDKAIAEEEETVRLIYLLARLHRSSGNKAKADQLIESTTEARPNDPRVHLVLSAYRARNGDFEGALAAAEKAIEVGPDNKAARLQKAEMLIELGFKAEREGAIDEARAIVDGILAAEPSSPKALFVDAKLKLAAGDVPAAVGALRNALETRSNWAEAHYLLGVALAVEEDYPAARTELARALEIDAGLLDAKYVISQVHFKLGEWDYCVDRGREYLREKPGDNKARVLVAQSLVRLNRIEEAQKDLELVPPEERDGEILYALGRIHQGRGRLEKAREHLLAADEAMPGNPDILRTLMAVDRRQNRFEESVARVTAAVEANAENAKLHQLAGLVAAVGGRHEDAEASFKKAIEIDPLDLSGYTQLARYYARTQRFEETARIYEQALEVKPEEGQLHHFLGVLYELSGDRERAIERYEEAIRYGPNLAEAKNNLAYIYADLDRNLDRALDLAQEAKAMLPDNPSVADTLGWVLVKRGVPSAAISYLKEAEARTDVDDANLGIVRFHLAQAYEANGDTEQAIASLDRSLETLASQMEAVRAGGEDPGEEPPWVAEARTMRERVAPGPTAGG